MKNCKQAIKWLKLRGLAYTLLLAVTAVCAIALGSVTTASADDPFDHPFAFTQSGFVVGTSMNGVNEFLGIPYAVPPVGALRWTPPKPYGFFHDFFLQATKFGSECTQPGPTGSENCLSLNVYTPQDHFGHEVRAQSRSEDR
jgi:para-nitrobenzyl esterase